MEERTRFDLGPEDIPAAWFNLLPSMVGRGCSPCRRSILGRTSP